MSLLVRWYRWPGLIYACVAFKETPSCHSAGPPRAASPLPGGLPLIAATSLRVRLQTALSPAPPDPRRRQTVIITHRMSTAKASDAESLPSITLVVYACAFGKNACAIIVGTVQAYYFHVLCPYRRLYLMPRSHRKRRSGAPTSQRIDAFQALVAGNASIG